MKHLKEFLNEKAINKFGYAKRQMRPPPSLSPSIPLRPPSHPTPTTTRFPRLPLAYRSRKHAFSRIREKRVTEGPTDGRTDQQTDRPSYRDAWSHLKTSNVIANSEIT